MNGRRVLSLLERFKSEINMAVNPNMSHAAMLDMLSNRVWESECYKKLPRWARSELAGYLSGRIQGAYLGHRLVWVHEFNGVRYDDWDKLPEGGKDMGRKGTLVSYHMWDNSGLRWN